MKVHEIFWSIQGEGVHIGVPALFLRFYGCNFQCTKDNVGFDCDTPQDVLPAEYTVSRLCSTLMQMFPAYLNIKNVILTGGEPFAQDRRELTALVSQLHKMKRFVFVETNGIEDFPHGMFDWVSCSPKYGTDVKLHQADEVKIVITPSNTDLGWRGIPDMRNLPKADFYLAMPAEPINIIGTIDPKEVIRVAEMVKEAGFPWRLGIQAHKYWRIR